jgi:hypothetical protein
MSDITRHIENVKSAAREVEMQRRGRDVRRDHKTHQYVITGSNPARLLTAIDNLTKELKLL